MLRLQNIFLIFSILFSSHAFAFKFKEVCKITLALGLKSEIKIGNKIIPVADTGYYGPNQGPALESGMEINSLILPKINFGLELKLFKKKPIYFLLDLIYEQRGLNYKEFLIDVNNEYNGIKYKYSFLEFGLGLSYIYEKFEFSLIGKYNTLLKTEVTFYPKGGTSFVKDYPTFHVFLTQQKTFELGILYEIYDQLFTGLTIEPLLENDTVYSIGMKIKIKI